MESNQSTGEAPLASADECMVDCSEITLPVSSIVTETSLPSTGADRGSQRSSVSPLSEVASQIVNSVLESSENEDIRMGSSSRSRSDSPDHETAEKLSAKLNNKDEDRGKSERPSKLPDCGSEPHVKSNCDTKGTKKSSSQIAAGFQDMELLQIAGIQMAALKTLNALIMSGR